MRSRIAPTPTGLLHLGHARTFALAHARCRAAGGVMILRIEDIDTLRCRPEFSRAAEEDLRALGLDWDEGPVFQSERFSLYRETLLRLRDLGAIYPCSRSRRDVAVAGLAPHDEDDAEPIFPAEWRPASGTGRDAPADCDANWRFRVPDGETIRFDDAIAGPQEFTAGKDFGDFVVWRRDGVPAYELAVVADDIAMRITEVVRGRDLLKSTARQLLLHRALGAIPPTWAHTPLITGSDGQRLAKRSGAAGIRALLAAGHSPAAILTADPATLL